MFLQPAFHYVVLSPFLYIISISFMLFSNKECGLKWAKHIKLINYGYSHEKVRKTLVYYGINGFCRIVLLNTCYSCS